MFRGAFFDKSGSYIYTGDDSRIDMPSIKKSRPCNLDWRFKTKKDKDGAWESDKSRLIVKGFTQTKGENFFETFYNCVASVVMRAICAWACAYQLTLFHSDISTAFLYAPMKDIVYCNMIPDIDMLEHSHFTQRIQDRLLLALRHNRRYQKGDERRSIEAILAREGWTMKLQLIYSLYGTHQAGRNFDQHSREILLSLDFNPISCDDHAFVYSNGTRDQDIWLLQTTDDFLWASKPENPLIAIKLEQLRKHFKMSFELVKKYGGVVIEQNLAEGTLRLQLTAMTLELQDKYAKQIVKTNRPIAPGKTEMKNFSKTDEPKAPKEDQVFYQSAIAATGYIQQHTRPDASKMQSFLAQFTLDPSEEQVEALKGYIGYLIGTADLGITYTRTGDEITDTQLVCWTDSDYATETDRVSVAGMCASICGGLVVWGSQKQVACTLNTMEAEYTALNLGAKEFKFCSYL